MTEKKDLIGLLNEKFVPLGFKRKGNYWVLNSDTLSKIVNLQKSNYGDAFYINYGYIIVGLELTTKTHVENRLASNNQEEQKRITDLLDLVTNIPTNQRLRELGEFVNSKIVDQMQAINTEFDLLNHLKTRPHLNDIPLVVKDYFDLENR